MHNLLATGEFGEERAFEDNSAIPRSLFGVRDFRVFVWWRREEVSEHNPSELGVLRGGTATGLERVVQENPR